MLNQKFGASTQNQIWLNESAYIPTDKDWLYFAGDKDLFTGKIVDYAMAERMIKNLVNKYLLKGFLNP